MKVEIMWMGNMEQESLRPLGMSWSAWPGSARLLGAWTSGHVISASHDSVIQWVRALLEGDEPRKDTEGLFAPFIYLALWILSMWLLIN